MVKHSSCITKTTLHSLTHDQNASNHHSGQHYKLYNWKIVTQLLFTPHGDAKILSSSTLVTRRKTSFFICLPCSKTYYLSYSIKKHDIINMADPSSMQECVSYMNLVMSLAHHRVSVAQWWSVGAQNPKVWVLIIFCYVPRSWQDEKHLSQILFISSQLSDLRKGAFTNWRTLMNPSLFFSLFLVI